MLFTVKLFQVIDDVIQPKVLYTFEAESEQVLFDYLDTLFPGEMWQREIIAQ